MPQTGSISKKEAIKQVAERLDGPIALDAFIDRVLAIWPSSAKNPGSAVRTSIRYEHAGRDVLFLDSDTLLPIQQAMVGVCFRVALAREEIERGVLNLYPNFELLHPISLTPDQFRFVDASGKMIPAELKFTKARLRTMFGVREVEQVGFDLARWFKKCGLRRNSHLLVTILDWNAGRYQLRPEPSGVYKKRRMEIRSRNQVFADMLFEMLEAARDEMLLGGAAIRTACLRIKAPEAVPCDHWRPILHEDPRMAWDGFAIRYVESPSPLERFLPEENRRAVPVEALVSKEQAGLVYRFKVSMKYRKGLWRRIEIKGGQTLRDFDGIIRSAFEHDFFDHLGGFWKLVRRGNSKNFREMDVGTVEPFGGGDGAAVQVAALGLEPGDQMKYVYDFGDWVEHLLELEAVGKAEPGVEYPRITDQNRPHHRFCMDCKAEGRKTVAVWVCIACSENSEEAVLVCEDCLEAHHEDHDADEILY